MKATRSPLRLCLHIVTYLSFIYTSCLFQVFWMLQIKSHELLFEFNYYGQFLLFKWYKMPFEHFFKISTQSATRAVRANVNVNCSCIICIHVVQEFLTRIKRWVEFVIFWSRKTFLTWERLEDAQNLNNGCGFSQQLSIARRIESKLLETKTLLIDYKQRGHSSW